MQVIMSYPDKVAAEQAAKQKTVTEEKKDTKKTDDAVQTETKGVEQAESGETNANITEEEANGGPKG